MEFLVFCEGIQSIIIQYIVNKSFYRLLSDLRCNVDSIQWYYDKLKPSREFCFANDDILYTVFIPYYDTLEILEWMHKSLKLNRSDFPGNLCAGIFGKLCKTSDLKMIEWWFKTFNISKEDCVLDYFNVFRSAFSHNKLEVAKWLFNTLDMKKEEIPSHIYKCTDFL